MFSKLLVFRFRASINKCNDAANFLYHQFESFTPYLDSLLTGEDYSVLMAYSVSGIHPHFLSAGKHAFRVRLNFRQSSFYFVDLRSGCLDSGCGIALGAGLFLCSRMDLYRIKVAVCLESCAAINGLLQQCAVFIYNIFCCCFPPPQ